MPDKPAGEGRLRPDFATLIGIVLAVGGIAVGLMAEGGKLTDLRGGSAALIVFGGTIGAVFVTTPMDTLRGAMRRLKCVFFEKTETPASVVEEIIAYATQARKQGLVALEDEADTVADPFLRKALQLAVDGADLEELRRMMELEISAAEQQGEIELKVFEAAGGYAPTIGIIGAVLGLIQVMKHIDNTKEVGSGIAVAFIATVYGVAAANLFFLPAANKIRARLHRRTMMCEMMLEGVVSIVEGLNPKLIRSKLEAFTRTSSSSAGSQTERPRGRAARRAAAEAEV